MKKKIITILVICSLVISACKTALAEATEYQQQANEIQSQSEEAKENLEEVTTEINTALQEVEDLNTSINEATEQISELSEQLNELNKSISEKEDDLEEKQEMLEKRLVASYMKGNNTYLDALFSGGLANFVSNYESIKQIAEYDNNLITEVKNAKQELEDEKSQVQTLKNEKETKSSELKKLKAEKEEKVNNLTEEQKAIEAQIEEYDNQMKALAQKEKALSDDTTITSTGQFTWPVPSSSTVSSNYGYRIHPISGVNKLHAGIDISASSGADIVAADSGTVILSSFGYNGGYGNYVIISHGNGLTTRYAHCSDLCVSVGDSVTKGQVIAKVGSTGLSTGNHCHFEVRVDGESKNPLNYL